MRKVTGRVHSANGHCQSRKFSVNAGRRTLRPFACHSHSRQVAQALADGCPSSTGNGTRELSTGCSSRRTVLQLGTAAALMSMAGGAGPKPVGAAEVAAASGASAALSLESLPPMAPTFEVERINIAPDLNISRVIKGCWQLSGGHGGERSSDRTSGQAAVEDFDKFVAAGITTFDAADHYGPAEALIGRYLASHPEQRPRTQVLTKYCVFSRQDMAFIDKKAVRQAVNQSRSRLGAERVDLMQYYWGDYDVNRYVDGALYLAEAASEGLIRHVGATNFDVPRMEAMVRAGVPLATNQLQYSLLDRRPENGMAAFCGANSIAMLPYGVLAGGFLSDKYLGVPASKISVDTYSKGKYSRVILAAGGWDWFQELLQVLDGVGRKHGTSISNVAARWVLQRPGVAAIILGARNADHVEDQRRLFSFSLDSDDLGVIQDVLDRGRRPRSDCYTWERGGEW